MGARFRQKVDYRRLHGDCEAGSELSFGDGGVDFKALHPELLAYSSYRQGAIRRLPAGQLTASWLQQHGTFRPVLVPAADGSAEALGIRLPAEPLTAAMVAGMIGTTYEAWTMDVTTQHDGPRWTVHQWLLYWEARLELSHELVAPAAAAVAQPPPPPAEDEADSFEVQHRPPGDPAAARQQLRGIRVESRRRLLMLPPLDVSGTSLAVELSPPSAVASLDLAASSARVGMAPEGSFLNFSLCPAGAAFWVHLVEGRLALALVPPTPRNLSTYAAWAGGARHTGVFLPAHCEGVARVDLAPGDTLLLPPGWAHAVAATAPALTVGGTFLRADSLALHLDAWRIEDHIGVRPRQRHPQFRALMWRTAARYARSLAARAAAQTEGFEAKVVERAAAMAREDAALAGAAAHAAPRGADKVGVATATARGTPARPHTILRRDEAGSGGGRKGRSELGTSRLAPPATGGRKRRKSPTDSFIESLGEEEAGDEAWGEHGEADWVPSSSNGEAELDLPASGEEEEALSGDEGASGGGERATRRQRQVLTARQAAAEGGGRSSTRFAGRMPALHSAALHEEEQDEWMGEEEQQQQAPPPPMVPIKLKVRLPGSQPPAALAQAPVAGPTSPQRLVIKLGRLPPGSSKPASSPPPQQQPTIPQVDGTADEGSNGAPPAQQPLPAPSPKPFAPAAAPAEELSEGEERGLAALLCVLRCWLRDPHAAHDLPAAIGDPRLMLARLELSMQSMGISLDPPPATDLGVVSPRSLLPAATTPRRGSGAIAEVEAGTSSSGGAAGAAAEAGGETSPEDVSGDNGFVVEESAGIRRVSAVGGTAGAAGGGARAGATGGRGRGGKKLSVKDRLKKKLGI